VLLDTRLDCNLVSNEPNSSLPVEEEFLSATVIIEEFIGTPVQTIFSSVQEGFLVSIDNASES